MQYKLLLFSFLCLVLANLSDHCLGLTSHEKVYSVRVSHYYVSRFFQFHARASVFANCAALIDSRLITIISSDNFCTQFSKYWIFNWYFKFFKRFQCFFVIFIVNYTKQKNCVLLIHSLKSNNPFIYDLGINLLNT